MPHQLVKSERHTAMPDRFRSVADNAPVMIWISDPDGHTTFVSQKWCAFTGQTLEHVLAGGWLDAIHAEDRAAVVRDFEKALACKGDFASEYRVRHVDGSTRWVVDTATPWRGPDGKFLGHIGSIMDITERKAAEAALQESEETLRTIIANEPECVKLLDRHGQVVDMNAAGLRMIDAPNLEAVKGHQVADLVCEADRPAFRKMIHDVFRGEARTLEFGINSFCGHHRILETHSVPLWNAGRESVRALIGVTRDITERKLAEKRQASLVRILEDSASEIYLCDRDSLKFVEVNRAARVNTGYEAHELVDMTPVDLKPEFDSSSFQQLISPLIDGREQQIRFTTFHRRKDGSQYPVEVQLQAGIYLEKEVLVATINDITVRVRAEKALQENEERLRLALFAAKQGIYDLDLRTGDAVVSPEYARMLGYGLEHFRETNADWHERLHPDERQKVYSVFEKYIAGELPEYRVEFRQRTRTGEWKWILSVGKIVEWAPDGTPLRMLGTHSDITDRVLAEEALKRSEERYRSFVEHTSEGIYLFELGEPIDTSLPTDQQIDELYNVGILATCNDQLAKMYGYAKGSELNGKSLVDLHGRRDVPENVAFLRQFVENGYRVERVISLETDREGQLKYFSNSAIGIVENGRLLRVWGSQSDVTRQKTAEISLAESARRFRSIFDATFQLTGLIALDGTLIEANQTALDFNALSREEVIGKPFWEAAWWVGDDLRVARLRKAVADAAKGQFVRYETMIRGLGDATGYIDFSLKPILNEAGEVSLLVAEGRDLSEWKQTQTQLQASLEEKEAMLKEIHHRVKNNLQVISSLLSLQSQRIEEPAYRSVLLESQSRVRAMALVHETLYQTESFAGIDMGPYVERLCRSLLQTFGGAGQVEIDSQVQIAMLDLDRALPVGLIISELVSNAIKYAFPAGCGGRIGVTFLPGPENALLLKVADNGCGLPTGLEHGGGKTLGLHLVQLLCRQLRGQMNVCRDHGTEFEIRMES
jgi:PAS domain S-box-containing protein